ncbi:hypothetical protein BGX26_001887 [Mortierella sp. AD094]|nr:hypothetical protein BGX26_001887 [Mortierella sp. AD094]
MVDDLIPPDAVNMLHKRLTGRFRPITTAIEGIIKTGTPSTWETVINFTEIMLTSWKEQCRRGNLCGELIRLEIKMTEHPEYFRDLPSIWDALALFLFRYNLLDETEIVLENDAHLIEAAFGRIKLFGGMARTVLDEPFVLKAVKAFFQERDPLLLDAAERAMLHSTTPSVHGNMWETCMPPVFIETFKNRPLSSWPLLNNNTLPDSLADFMKAHVENRSKRGDQDIPPFYFPAPHVSGPDIVFYIKINDRVYPVFVQLKLRQVLEGSDIEKALATVSSHAVQEKMRKEHEKIEEEQEKMQKEQKMQQKKRKDSTSSNESVQSQPPRLQDYCPTGVYISMVLPIQQRLSSSRLSALILNQSWKVFSASPSTLTIIIFLKSFQIDMSGFSTGSSNISDQQLMNQPRS